MQPENNKSKKPPIRKGNLNKKDRARNMRGIKKYEDKINFIIKHNIDSTNNGDKTAFKKRIAGIKGDKEFLLEKELENENKNPVKTDYVFDDEENDQSLVEELAESYLKTKLKNYIPKTDLEIKDFLNSEVGKNFVQDSENKTENKTENKIESSFNVLFENERVIIIDKPACIMVHPDDRGSEITISDLAYYFYPNMRDVGEGDRFGIVHRLDRNTTGVLVLCKTRDAHRDMKNVFRTHKVRKVYRAIVEGNVRDEMGIIDKPMARTRSDFRKKGIVDMFSKDFRGAERSAITRYKVLARSIDKKFTYIELYPLTGRTHQLRVHMRSIRHPIIGDDLYGSEKGMTMASRSMLHAYKIEFTLRKQEVKATANIPKDMQEMLDKNFGV